MSSRTRDLLPGGQREIPDLRGEGREGGACSGGACSGGRTDQVQQQQPDKHTPTCSAGSKPAPRLQRHAVSYRELLFTKHLLKNIELLAPTVTQLSANISPMILISKSESR